MISPLLRFGNGHEIGCDSSTFIVAEIGANHGGDPSAAHRMIDIAAECGVDAIKFQTYTSQELVADYDRLVTWGPPGDQHRESIGELFDRVSLDRKYHGDLFEHVRAVGLVPFSTPFSEDGVEFLISIGCPLLKIASSDIGHLALVRTAAESDVPIIISTGKSTLGELSDAVDVLRQTSSHGFAVLHCVAEYPAPYDTLNLRFIETLSRLFPDALTGFSDHSVGTVAAPVAVALGARIVEKHFTLSHDAGGPDDWFSADPGEMHSLVEAVRSTEMMIGDGVKTITDGELEERRVSTRSIVLAVDKPTGEPLEREDLKVVRPGYGIEASRLQDVIGLRLTRDLAANSVLRWEDFK